MRHFEQDGKDVRICRLQSQSDFCITSYLKSVFMQSGPKQSKPLYFPIASVNKIQSKQFLAYVFLIHSLTQSY